MTRPKLRKWLTLGGLSVLGVCAVSIPVTIALALSAMGTSDVLTLGEVAPKAQHTTPAKAVAGLRCTATKGYYALAFQDGPSATTTARLVRALGKANAVATFFDVGGRAAVSPDLVELQRSAGQVANHSYSHVRLSTVSSARRVQELQAAAQVLDFPNVFFLAPYGEAVPAVDADARRSGLIPVHGALDAQADGLSAAAITRRALAVKPGGIVLMSEGVENVVAALPGIVERLRERGMCPGFLGASGGRIVAVKP
jgi:peptidoglycan-N-acetylglucosamine deacetylase